MNKLTSFQLLQKLIPPAGVFIVTTFLVITTLVFSGPYLAGASLLLSSKPPFLPENSPSKTSQSQSSSDQEKLSLDRIFASSEFNTHPLPPIHWVPELSGYLTLEPSASLPDGQDIILYTLPQKKRQVLIEASALVPFGEEKPISIEDFTFSRDRTKLLIYTNSRRVWRRNTRGDYWVLDLNSGLLQKVGAHAQPSSLMFAKLSPRGDQVAYVYKNNIWVEDLKTHQPRQLTRDGSKTIINGTSDWVYEEEFGLRDAFRWSPDGQYIAFWQFNTQDVPRFTLINFTDSLYPQLIQFPYPKVGQTNSACRLGVVKVSGGPVTWIKAPGDPRNNYIARLTWVEHPPEIIFQQLNRPQNTLRIIKADIQTGDVQIIHTETDETWVEVVDEIFWLKNGQYFTWISEKDGWRHVYLISREGKREPKLLTLGNYDVIKLLQVDEKRGWLYFIASPHNPTQRYLYRSRLKSSGRPQRLTPTSFSGTNTYRLSPDCRWAIHTYSNFDTPPLTEIIELPSHRPLAQLEDHAELKKKLARFKRRPTEFFRIDIGEGVQLDGWCIYPPDFDPSLKYPLLVHVYGEPAGVTVVDQWRGKRYLWHLYLAQQGYFVISIDNRGTPAPRGREWRKRIYGQIGILASQDQAAALRRFLQERPYIDPERIGVWGWSGGGSMTLNLLFRYPKLYKVGLSVAPVSNQLLYDSIYQERYMGPLEKNRENYLKGSPITYAHQLEGDLLLVHGTGDDNVHFQSTAALINELIKHNKLFWLMIYPNRTHSISEGKNTTRHLYRTLTDFLLKHLPPGGR
jgi:dipeptidyl-peptidase-4